MIVSTALTSWFTASAKTALAASSIGARKELQGMVTAARTFFTAKLRSQLVKLEKHALPASLGWMLVMVRFLSFPFLFRK